MPFFGRPGKDQKEFGAMPHDQKTNAAVTCPLDATTPIQREPTQSNKFVTFVNSAGEPVPGRGVDVRRRSRMRQIASHLRAIANLLDTTYTSAAGEVPEDVLDHYLARL